MQIFNITKYKLQQTVDKMYKKHIHLARKPKSSYLLSRTLPSQKKKKMKKQLQQFFQLYLKTVIYNSICTSIRNLNVTRQLFFETTFLLKTKIKGS